MKRLSLLILAFLSISIAYSVESKTRIGDRDVNIITGQSTDAPKICNAALLEKIKKQGWHDEIYNSVDDGKACLVFSQRVVERGEWTKIRITLWKATRTADGKTATESHVYVLDKTEVNSFLDEEIRPLFLKFSRVQ